MKANLAKHTNLFRLWDPVFDANGKAERAKGERAGRAFSLRDSGGFRAYARRDGAGTGFRNLGAETVTDCGGGVGCAAGCRGCVGVASYCQILRS